MGDTRVAECWLQRPWAHQKAPAEWGKEINKRAETLIHLQVNATTGTTASGLVSGL